MRALLRTAMLNSRNVGLCTDSPRLPQSERIAYREEEKKAEFALQDAFDRLIAERDKLLSASEQEATPTKATGVKHMTGRRIESPFAADGSLIGEWPRAGDYYFYPQVGWCGVTPDGRQVGLRNHEVVEHEDGTITASPSILVDGGGQQDSWHGYLERGAWRQV